jgi:hypothetical protein
MVAAARSPPLPRQQNELREGARDDGGGAGPLLPPARARLGHHGGRGGQGERVGAGEDGGLRLTLSPQRHGRASNPPDPLPPLLGRGRSRRSSPVFCRHSSPAGSLPPLLAGDRESPPARPQEWAVARWTGGGTGDGKGAWAVCLLDLGVARSIAGATGPLLDFETQPCIATCKPF